MKQLLVSFIILLGIYSSASSQENMSELLKLYPLLMLEPKTNCIYYDKTASKNLSVENIQENNYFIRNIFFDKSNQCSKILYRKEINGGFEVILNDSSDSLILPLGYLFIPGNGVLYFVTTGPFSNVHVIDKYVVTNNVIKKVNQPLYFHNRQYILRKDITYFSDELLTEPIGSIGKGRKFLLIGYKFDSRNDGNSHYLFLIKSEIGLIGWYKPHSLYWTNSDIENLSESINEL